MDKVKRIERKDLIFSGNLEDDRVNCYVKLDDYDWMNYSFKTTLKTMEQGVLEVKIDYAGAGVSFMDIIQKHPGNTHVWYHQYRFPSNIFKKHIKTYMRAFMKQWDDISVFCPEGYILDFFNDIISNAEDFTVDKEYLPLSDEERYKIKNYLEACRDSEDSMIQRQVYGTDPELDKAYEQMIELERLEVKKLTHPRCTAFKPWKEG